MMQGLCLGCLQSLQQFCKNSSSSNKPVLLYVNYGNGHFTSDVDVNFKEFADMVSFSLWQVGHPKFKMTE